MSGVGEEGRENVDDERSTVHEERSTEGARRVHPSQELLQVRCKN